MFIAPFLTLPVPGELPLGCANSEYMCQELHWMRVREEWPAPASGSLPSSFPAVYTKPCPSQLSPSSLSCSGPSLRPLNLTQFWALITEAANFSLAYAAEEPSADTDGVLLAPKYLRQPLIWCWLPLHPGNSQSSRDQLQGQTKTFSRDAHPHAGLEGPFPEDEGIDAAALTSGKCSAEPGLGDIAWASR